LSSSLFSTWFALWKPGQDFLYLQGGFGGETDKALWNQWLWGVNLSRNALVQWQNCYSFHINVMKVKCKNYVLNYNTQLSTQVLLCFFRFSSQTVKLLCLGYLVVSGLFSTLPGLKILAKLVSVVHKNMPELVVCSNTYHFYQ